MRSHDNAQAGLFDWGTPAWMQPDPESATATDRASLDVDHAIGHIVSRGFTERQARFLVLVARHSGVCVMHQYAAFGGVAFGHTTRRFFAKLERLGWVSTYDCARKRARIYHVRHRELYDAIGDPDSRLRRPPTVPRALERLMLLDVVLAEPDLIWLSTPDEKLAHVSVLTSIKADALPQAASPLGSHEPARCFPDHAPVGIHPQGRWVVVCLLTQDGKRELRTFLERHLAFLAALSTWTLRVAIPAHMAPFGLRLVEEVTKGLSWRFDGQFRDDLVWYFEQRRSGGNPDSLPDADDRAWRARKRQFSGIAFSALYPVWLTQGDNVFPTVAARVGDALLREAATIEPLVLPHAYSHLAPLVGVG